MPYLGAHTIDNGGIHMAVARAARAGMTAFQVFTAKPRFINDRISIRPERVKRFREALSETKIQPRNVLVHAPYSLSVANADAAKWARASAGSPRGWRAPRSSAWAPPAFTRGTRATVIVRQP